LSGKHDTPDRELWEIAIRELDKSVVLHLLFDLGKRKIWRKVNSECSMQFNRIEVLGSVILEIIFHVSFD